MPATTGRPSKIKPCVSPPAPQNRSTQAIFFFTSILLFSFRPLHEAIETSRSQVLHSFSRPSFSFPPFVFRRPNRAPPRVDFFGFEFPESTDAMGRHVAFVDPRIHGVLAHAEVFGDFFDRQPAISHVLASIKRTNLDEFLAAFASSHETAF